MPLSRSIGARHLSKHTVRLSSRASSPACAFELRRRVCPVLAPASQFAATARAVRSPFASTSRRTMATATPAGGTMTDPAATGAISPDADNTSGVTGDMLEAKLREAVGAEHVEVQDISGGCGQSFAATIVSPLFEKKMTLARHRLVNGALREEIGKIHAWTPKCYTPAEWESKRPS